MDGMTDGKMERQKDRKCAWDDGGADRDHDLSQRLEAPEEPQHPAAAAAVFAPIPSERTHAMHTRTQACAHAVLQ
jgi:hypothetical protein